MTKYDFHPASNIYRLLAGDELKEVRESIKKFGQQTPIVVYKNLILDGRHRYICCQELGIEPWVVEVKDADLDGLTPTEFVLVANGHRRHDDLGQRQIAAGKIALALEAEAKAKSSENLKKGREIPEKAKWPDRETASAIKRASEATGVPETTAKRSKAVVAKSPPEVVKAVEQGDVKVADAAAVADRPAKEQRKAVEAVKAGKAQQLAADTTVAALDTRVEAGSKGGRGNKADSDTTSFPGRGAEYIVRRLKRDAPEIATALAQGEYKSARAAGIAAGIVKVPTRLQDSPPLLAY